MRVAALLALLLSGGPTTGVGGGGPTLGPAAGTRATCGNGPMACDTPLRVNPVTPGSCNPLNRQVTVTVGDSILQGLASGGALLLQTELGQPNYYVQGCASGGFKVADCIARFSANAHVGANIVAWNCAINNILNGDSAAITWAQAEAALNIIRGQGVKVVVASIGPCGGYSGCNNAANDAYNALLQTWCIGQGATNCYFWNANAYLANPGNPLQMRPECVTDWLHPGALCEPGYFEGFATGAEALTP